MHGCPITRLPNPSLDTPFYQIRVVILKAHASSMMHSGQKQCSVGTKLYSVHFYDSVQSVAVWYNNDLKTLQDLNQNRGLFFHSFGFITKLNNLQMVTNNKLGKFYD